MIRTRKTLGLLALLAGCTPGQRLLDSYPYASAETAMSSGKRTAVTLENGTINVYYEEDGVRTQYFTVNQKGIPEMISYYPFVLMDGKNRKVFYDFDANGIADSTIVMEDINNMKKKFEGNVNLITPNWLRIITAKMKRGEGITRT